MKLSTIRGAVFIIAFLLLAGQVGYWLGKHDSGNLTPKAKLNRLFNRSVPSANPGIDISLFWEVWDKLHYSYIDKEALDDNKMILGAISGMTAAVNDPYTVFLPPEENKETKADLNGSFDGVGIQLGFKDTNKLAVMAPLAGMPAEKAGVRAGDLITHIKDERQQVDRETVGLSLPEAVKLIRGPKGTPVILTLARENRNEPFNITLIRETISVPSVALKFGTSQDGKWQEVREGNTIDQIAWLALSRFGDKTESEWNTAVDKVIANCGTTKLTCRGLILDLRNNPGGYLNGAVQLAGEFLNQNELVVKQAEANGTTTDYKVERLGRLTSIPMVILVNGGSASASEILAGALRDHNRAKLIGEKTFGKGTIQEALDLRSGAGLHITVAKWLLPKGEWLNKEGLTPDLEIKADENNPSVDVQLARAAQELLKK